MVSVKDIKKIKLGESKTFPVDHPSEFHQIRVNASYVGLTYPELRIKYKVSINRVDMNVTISAIGI